MSDHIRGRRIDASPEAIWAVLADFAAISSWADNVDHSCLLHREPNDEPMGMSRRIQSGRNTLVERVVVWEPGVTLAYDIEGLPKVIRSVRNQWHLGSDATSTSTTVTLTSTVDAGPRPPQQVVARIVGRVLAKQSDVMLDGLAAHLEGSARV